MIISGKKGDYEIVIGLEVHAQIKTAAKLFSGGANAFSLKPNRNVDFLDAGMPGILPLPNPQAIQVAIKAGLAIDGKINQKSMFDRKNYNYPDLPLGYQITQFYYPIVNDGKIEIDVDGKKVIGVERIHIEQDAGKLMHSDGKTKVDLNRAGIPLMEIVSKPEMRSPAEAVAYLKKLRDILIAVDASDADMYKGQFRCDANVSVRLKGESKFGVRCEIKNLNSFRYVEKAIEFEAQRQVEAIENGEEIRQQTKLFKPNTGVTVAMRDKENAADYRYFADPDLMPVFVKQEEIDFARKTLPELPDARFNRYTKDYGISQKYAELIMSEKYLTVYFEFLLQKHEPKLCTTWLCDEMLGRIAKYCSATRLVDDLLFKIENEDIEFTFRVEELLDFLAYFIRRVEGLNFIETSQVMNDMRDNVVDSGSQDDKKEIISIAKRLSQMVDDRVKSIRYFHDKDVNGDGDFGVEAFRADVEQFLGIKLDSEVLFSVVPPEVYMKELLDLIKEGTINGKIAKEVLDKMMFVESSSDGLSLNFPSPRVLVDEMGLKQVDDAGEIELIVKEVLSQNPSQLQGYLSGKTALFGYFVGQVMKKTQGKANPKLVNDVLHKLINEQS